MNIFIGDFSGCVAKGSVGMRRMAYRLRAGSSWNFFHAAFPAPIKSLQPLRSLQPQNNATLRAAQSNK